MIILLMSIQILRLNSDVRNKIINKKMSQFKELAENNEIEVVKMKMKLEIRVKGRRKVIEARVGVSSNNKLKKVKIKITPPMNKNNNKKFNSLRISNRKSNSKEERDH